VVLASLFSTATSVDLGVTVNQLNVTAPYASVTWQSVLLENAAPGAQTWVSSSQPQQQQQQQHCQELQHCL
jgi:hypothetical protein